MLMACSGCLVRKGKLHGTLRATAARQIGGDDSRRKHIRCRWCSVRQQPQNWAIGGGWL